MFLDGFSEDCQTFPSNFLASIFSSPPPLYIGSGPVKTFGNAKLFAEMKPGEKTEGKEVVDCTTQEVMHTCQKSNH